MKVGSFRLYNDYVKDEKGNYFCNKERWSTMQLIRDLSKDLEHSICFKHTKDKRDEGDTITDMDGIYMPVTPIDDSLLAIVMAEPELKTIAFSNVRAFEGDRNLGMVIQTLLLNGFNVILTEYYGDTSCFNFSRGDDNE
jgi:hypothetical protein